MLLIFTLAAFQGTWAAPEHGTLVVIQSVCFYVRVASCSEHTNARGRMMTEVTCLAALFLTVPASAASAERSFGTLRHIKSYLGQPCHRWCLCMLIVNELEALVWTISYESSCWRQPNGEKPLGVYKPLAISLLLKNIHRGKKEKPPKPKVAFLSQLPNKNVSVFRFYCLLFLHHWMLLLCCTPNKFILLCRTRCYVPFFRTTLPLPASRVFGRSWAPVTNSSLENLLCNALSLNLLS